VPFLPVRLIAPAHEVREGLRRLRRDLDIPPGFSDPVTATARSSVAQRHVAGADRIDARDLPLVTIDPPRSRDLDQAFTAARQGDGYRVHYAIADVAAFVAAGDELDREAHTRGVTLYLPDRRAPLYPKILGEGAASLLPGRNRPALLWTFDLDESGEPTSVRVERAVVRSRHALAYSDVQRDLEAGRAADAFIALREIGQLREERERDRGGASLRVPTQEVLPAPGGYQLEFDAPLPVEDWNAQISLLTGMAAARLMIDAGVGILRTLPPPDDHAIDRLRRTAHALGIEWPAEMSYAQVVRTVDPQQSKDAAFLTQAVQVLRGAGYALVSAPGDALLTHAALAAPYAHVTAPLRRLADRFANEIVLAVSAGREPPGWAVDGLSGLPELMQDATRRSKAVERAVVDLVEAVLLRRHVGSPLCGTVVDLEDHRATVQLHEPPVVARVDVGASAVALGSEVEVRVVAADPSTRQVTLEPV
jgi:exoribonuclease R